MKQVEWFKNSIIYHILIDRFAGFKSKKKLGSAKISRWKYTGNNR